MEGFRRAYQLPQTWGLIKERAIACSLVVLAGTPMTLATTLVAFGGQIENRVLFLTGHRLGPLILVLWTGIRRLIAILTSIAVTALIYHNAVPRTHRWHRVLPGASLAIGMWFGSTLLFGWYLETLRRLQRDIRIVGGRHRFAHMDVCKLIDRAGRRRVQLLLFPRTIAHPPAAVEMPKLRVAA
jgi:uncharacterized BrkB/YihY/UPF0761 family membrane protein